MAVYSIRKKAKELGVGLSVAMKARLEYLQLQIGMGVLWIDNKGEMPDVMMHEAVDESLQILSAMKESRKLISNSGIDISDKVAQAKTYPIDRLIEFVRGKAVCFNHEDKSPSAYWATRQNTLNCPVCDKRWDSIQILVERDGMSFHEAVKKLCSL